MTNISAEARASIATVQTMWKVMKAHEKSDEETIRARVAAELGEKRRIERLEVAAAMQAALDAGATKLSLKLVTTKDRVTFDSYLALLHPTEATETEDTAPKSTVGLTIAWATPETLTITLDPRTVVKTDTDRSRPELWTGEFEEFTRPVDGKLFIRPLDSVPLGHGVTDWLRSDRANEEVIIAWIVDHP